MRRPLDPRVNPQNLTAGAREDLLGKRKFFAGGAYVQVGSGVRIVRIERFHTLIRHLCRTLGALRSPQCLHLTHDRAL